MNGLRLEPVNLPNMKIRFSIDRGGTFTDVFAEVDVALLDAHVRKAAKITSPFELNYLQEVIGG